MSLLSRSLSIFALLFLLAAEVRGQDISYRHASDSRAAYNLLDPAFADRDTTAASASFSDPKDVMYKSLTVPGWGQIANGQAWKVPIIYSLLGGLGYYSVHLTKKYHDYRAAYYNRHPETPNDFRFGPTPAYIPRNADLRSLKTIRNGFRNRRDFMYIAIGLAYGLNVVDAYVFAHMRSFDVSEDLSMRTSLQPAVTPAGSPGLSLKLQLFRH